MASKKFKPSEVADAIIESKGYVSKAADVLGCHPATIYNYIDAHPTVKAALEAVRNERHDYVESKLMTLIGNLNPSAIMFYLKCQGKDRGWIERHQVEHSGSVDVTQLSDEELEAIVNSK